MVVVATALVARFAPAADVAMLDRFGISIIAGRDGRGGNERTFCLPESRRRNRQSGIAAA